MATIVREESFGGLILDSHSYNTRAVNAFTFNRLLEHASGMALLDNSEAQNLRKAGFTLEDESMRVIQKLHGKDCPILSAPLTLWIELTSACSLNCRQCFVNRGCDTLDGHLPLDVVLELIDEAASYGVPRVTLTGGEPFLYPALGSVIKHANELDLGLRIFSNGSVELPVYNKFLEGGVIDRLFLSLDGFREHHDYLRGKKSFNHALRSLAYLSSHSGIRSITLSTTLDRENYKNFAELLNVAIEYDINSFLLRPMMSYPWTEEVSSFTFQDKMELHLALQLVESMAQKVGVECQISKIPFMPVGKRAYFDDFPNNISLWYLLGIEHSVDCVGGNLVFGIRSDGIAIPCGFIDLDYDAGPQNSVFERRFHDLWLYSPNLNRLRNIVPNRLCAACRMNRICNGGCRAHSHLAGMGLGGIDPYCLLHPTPYGEAQSLSVPDVQQIDFDPEEESFFIADGVVVSKCGWATYG